MAEVSKCEASRPYPGGRFGRCDQLATNVWGWRELCHEHWLAMLRRPDLKPTAAEKVKAEKRDGLVGPEWEAVYVPDVDEPKFRQVLKTIWDAPDMGVAA